ENMEQHQKVTVYSPESGLRRPFELIRSIFVDLVNSRELAWRLFVRNFSAMYRQSLLGFVWALIPPLLTASVWVFLNGQRVINVDDPGVPYPAFVLTSVLLWSVFAQSLVTPITSVIQGRSILVKINFPRESLVLAGLLQILFDFLVRLVLSVIVLIVFNVIIALTAWLAPFCVLSLVVLGTCLGIILLPLGMLSTAIQKIILAITPFWMLLTPVIYPAPRSGIATMLNKFNPVSPLLSTTRDWLF